MEYCTKNDVEALLNLKFDSESQPTETKVNLFIKAIASELSLTLRKVGLTVPPTNQYVLDTLLIYNGYGAAGLVALTYGGNVENIGTTQGVYYRDEYKAFIQSVLANPDLLKPEDPMTGVMIASTNVTDGHTPLSVVEDRIGDDWTP